MSTVEAKVLTERQAAVLKFIMDTVTEKWYQPSIREIMLHFGYTSLNSIPGFLVALRKKGYVELTERGSRCIGITNKARDWYASL